MTKTVFAWTDALLPVARRTIAGGDLPRVAVCALLVLLIGLAGCGDPSESQSTNGSGESQRAEPDLSVGVSSAAGLGDDLVVLTAAPDDLSKKLAFLRRSDGGWQELPDPPAGPSMLASAGDSIVMASIRCDSECLGNGRLEFSTLDADLSSWCPLKGPSVSVAADTEVAVGRSPQAFAWFEVGSVAYVVSGDGTVQQVPESPYSDSETAFRCFTGDLAVLVPWRQVPVQGAGDATVRMTLHGVAIRLDPKDVRAGWQKLASVPSGVETTYGDECVGDALTFHSDGKTVGLNVKTGEWAIGESNYAALNGTSVFYSGAGRIAQSPSGNATIAVLSDGRLVRTTDNANWIDTGQKSSGVFSTDSEVLSFRPDTNTFEVVS